MINLKVGDKVTSTKYPDRVFNLAWYKMGITHALLRMGI